MVARGVPAPNMNGNRGYTVCLYFEDQASDPVQKLDLNSHRCRQRSTSRAVPDDEHRILWAATSFDTSNVGNQNCLLTSLPDDTHVAAIALSEGLHRRYRDDPIREINVEVTRDGPTVLYLSMDGGAVRWNVKGPQVVAIYARGAASLELTEVVLDDSPYDYVRLNSPSENCPQFAPLWPNRLGPAIAQLDEMFETLTGQRIDQLITFTDSGRAWRRPETPIPTLISILWAETYSRDLKV